MAKKLIKIDEKELRSLEDQEAPVIHAKELEEGLKKISDDVSEIIISGTQDNLTELSWTLYEKFKKGQLQQYFKDDKEIETYYKIRNQEAILKMITFIDLATNEILSKKKLDSATLKELTSSMKTVSEMINNMLGNASTIVEHKHKHTIQNEDEIKERMQKTKEKMDAIDAEFEELIDADSNPDDNIDI